MVSYIAISKEKYESELDWENAIHNTIKILMENGYVVKMELQDFGLMLIEFDYQDCDLSNHRCVWLTDMEMDEVNERRV